MIDIYTKKIDSKDWIFQNDLYFNLNTGNEEMSQKEIDLMKSCDGLTDQEVKEKLNIITEEA